MARKRMIDPEFWSDEKIALLSPECRLFFIGLWNFSDDEGIFKNHPSLLASEIFPYEKEYVNKVVDFLKEIEEKNLIYCYSRTGQGYGIVLNFKKHQSISHPQPSKLPRPGVQNPKYKSAIFKRDNFICGYCKKELDPHSKYPQDNPTLDHIIPQSKDGSDLPDNLITACAHCNKGKCDSDVESFRERSENINGTLPPNISKDKLSKEKISEVELVFKNWNERMPWKVKEITGSRLTHLKERLKEKQFIDNFHTILTKILESDFLSGRKPSKDHEGFRADMDWIIKNDTNYIKVLEDKYAKREVAI